MNVDETEELDYGAEDVIPSMYDYQKRDIAEEFGIVQNTDRVVVDEPEIEREVYEDYTDDLLQSFHNNHKGDILGYNEDGDRFEPVTYMKKRNYDTEEVSTFEDVSDALEVAVDNFVGDGTVNDVAEDIVEADCVVLDVNAIDVDIVKATELTLEEQAEQIAVTIQKYYKSYDYLSSENKARLFNFRIDDNSYNLELHAGVLKKLGIRMYGSERFEDYQSIYEETMKKAEKRDSEYERGYEDKKWERGRGR